MANFVQLLLFISLACLIRHTNQQQGTIGGPLERQSCDCGVANRRTRIVNGVNTTNGEYPWMCAIYRTNYDPNTGQLLAKVPICGGALISQWNIITAAHCVFGLTPINIQVDLGDYILSITNEAANQFVNVSTILPHPGYNTQTHVNDIAILTLAQPVTFTSNIRPICIPPPGLDVTGEQLVVTGWGTDSQGGQEKDVLQEVTIPVYPVSDCKQRFQNTTANIDIRTICTQYTGSVKQDACQGDSGGPAAYECGSRFMLAGVVSLSIGCALYPGVYTNVSYYRDWIIQNTPPYTLCGYDCYPQPPAPMLYCGLANDNPVQVRSNRISKRIVGGSVTSPSKYPWMAAIYIELASYLSFTCGATVISQDWVMTAAKCVFGIPPAKVWILMGNYDLNVYPPPPQEVMVNASTVVINPNYNSLTLTNNIALIKLTKSVTFGYDIYPICLPAASMVRYNFGDGTPMIFLGWGLTSDGTGYSYSGKLKEVTLTSVNDNQCSYEYGSSAPASTTVCTASSINGAVCDGDKGGPGMMKDSDGIYFQVWLQSFRSAEGNCTLTGSAGNLEIIPYLSWIASVTGVQGVVGSSTLN